MAKLFKLPGPGKNEAGEDVKAPYPLKGKVTVAGTEFTDGQALIHDDIEAGLKAQVLTRYHGVTVETVAESATAEAAVEGSLAATETKK